MILLHSGDWHLGKRLDLFSRLAEQEDFLKEFCALADEVKADVILLSGDIFDHFHPPTEATALYYQTLSRLTAGGSRPVVVIAGNHDSPDHILAPTPLARELGIILVGYPRQEPETFRLDSGVAVTRTAAGFVELDLPGHPPLRIITTPYANALRLRQALDPEQPETALAELLSRHWAELARDYMDHQGINILMAHLFIAENPNQPEPEPDDEKPILYIGGIPALGSDLIPNGVQYAALGHLHRPHRIPHPEGIPVVYSGSPLSYSFAEANQTKQVVRLSATPGSPADWAFIPLRSGRPLLRYRTEDAEDAVAYLQAHPEAYIELTFVSDTYLSTDIKHRLESAHDRLFIIPETRLLEQQEGPGNLPALQLDHIEDVFCQYFQERHAQLPPADLIDLFRELLNEPTP